MEKMDMAGFINFASKDNFKLSDYYIKDNNDEVVVKKKSGFQKSFLGRLIRVIFGINKSFNHVAFERTANKIMNFIENNPNKFDKTTLDKLGAKFLSPGDGALVKDPSLSKYNCRLLDKHRPIAFKLDVFFRVIKQCQSLDQLPTKEKWDRSLAEYKELGTILLPQVQREKMDSLHQQLNELISAEVIPPIDLETLIKEIPGSDSLDIDRLQKIVGSTPEFSTPFDEIGDFQIKYQNLKHLNARKMNVEKWIREIQEIAITPELIEKFKVNN